MGKEYMEKDNKLKKRSRGDNSVLEVPVAPATPEKTAAQIKAENGGGSSTPLPDAKDLSHHGQKPRKALLPPWFVIDK